MLSPAHFNKDPETDEDFGVINFDANSLHRKLNYDICTALDMTKMGIVLDKMEATGLNHELRKIYYAQAEALLALLRSENNRLFNL